MEWWGIIARMYASSPTRTCARENQNASPPRTNAVTTTTALSARLRYFDPVRRRAGVPDDVGALVSELRDDRTVVTLVNVSRTTPRDVVVQGGGYGEHQILSADVNGKITPINARDFTVRLAPGAGATLTLAMKRYANPPDAKFPWDR